MTSLFPQIQNQTQIRAQTGGNGVVPVSTAYCLKTSAGCGPSIRNTSMIPHSENQCVSTWGISSPFTRSTSLANMFYRFTQTNCVYFSCSSLSRCHITTNDKYQAACEDNSDINIDSEFCSTTVHGFIRTSALQRLCVIIIINNCQLSPC